MSDSEKYFCWHWKLASSPEALWPLISDTDRFNRDCGFPNVTMVPSSQIKGPKAANAHRLRARRLGIPVEWDERPFEWVANRSFGVERIFYRGPFSRILARCKLEPDDSTGTLLTYEIWFTPSNLLGRVALALGGAQWQFHQPFNRVFRHYDQIVQQGATISDLGHHHNFSPGGARRAKAIRKNLVQEMQQPAELVDRLVYFVTTADDLDCQRIRAYALADQWRTDRRATLLTCMHATRAGLIDFRWDVLCPHCRGAKSVANTLSQLPNQAYCDTCHIDFIAEFDRSVELTFTPNPAIRRVPRIEYCIGGPQITPHIVAQQNLQSGEQRSMPLDLPNGRYRVRAPGMAKPWRFRVSNEGQNNVVVQLDDSAPIDSETAFISGGNLTFTNPAAEAQQAVVEHVAWTDQATIASEVTCLQLFRDMFSHEVLRPGTQISVGHMTIVFTDLKGSTQMYRNIGDAPAFSRVLTHFELLKATVESEDGAIVKTMGDAIMAVFPRPAPALRCMIRAHRQLALSHSAAPWGNLSTVPLPEPLDLKVALHHGPCIAINQNDRIDYFGTTVNIAARLCNLCSGSDLMISQEVRNDPEVDALLTQPDTRVIVKAETTQLRGMADDVFQVHRVSRV